MTGTDLMRDFPPAESAQVTLANWRKPPFNIWAFQHVRELIPSVEIANDPEGIRHLPEGPAGLETLAFEAGGTRHTLDSFLKATDTDGFVVLQDGRLVLERYANGMTPATQHILMSVSKSVLGLIAGMLVEAGAFDPAQPVTEWIPEVKGTAYDGATIRNLLDMRAGILFDEDYHASAGPIIEYRKAQGWDPHEVGEAPSDLRRFFACLTEADGSHKQRFHYVSPNTDLLGWLLERASGRRYADLVSERLWQPLGAGRDAYITVDRLGAPRVAGGFCATTRDLARLGLLMAEGGRRDGRQIVPAAWIDDILTAGDRQAWDTGDFLTYFPGIEIHYRSKWYVRRGPAPMMFGVGVFGQNVFVAPEEGLVVAKFSSQALPMDEARIPLTMAGIEAIRAHLRQ